MKDIIEDHQIASAFPLLNNDRLNELATSIAQRGLLDPIVLFEGKILDGRNRYRACLLTGVEPHFIEYNGANPWLHVWDRNAQRRDITDDQRALIWMTAIAPGSEAWLKVRQKIALDANTKRSIAAKGRKNSSSTTSATTPEHINKEREAAAEFSQTNRGAIHRAERLSKADPELAQKVIKGEIAMAKALREVKRAEFEKQTIEPSLISAMGPFDLILADPPWRYDEATTTPTRTVECQYPTEHLQEIFSHIPESAKDAILFLWATAPLLPEALRVMKAWSFTYKTQAIWDKEIIGLGYWFRIQHEVLLVGVKGSVKPTPEPARISSIFREKRGKHSRKPECVYRWLERAFPRLTKLEMYARKKREGWSSWGNEV